MAIPTMTYGPFIDEDFFYYHDTRTVLSLDELKIWREGYGLIGFNDVEKIHNKRKAGSFNNVLFSGIATLTTVNNLCQKGLQALLHQVHQLDPMVGKTSLQDLCKEGKIMVELHCQLKGMPICYMSRTRPNDIIIISKNYNNLNSQRRYCVNTFHKTCLRRSVPVLHRYMVLRSVLDAFERFEKEVAHEDRDVHWLVDVYRRDYKVVFPGSVKPQLHRADIYDHFATHANWLATKLKRKWNQILDREKWAEWVDQVDRLRKKAHEQGSKWGSMFEWEETYNKIVEDDDDSEDSDNNSQNNHGDDLHTELEQEREASELEPEPDPEPEPESESEGSGSQYDIHDQVRGLFNPKEHRSLLDGEMPRITWFWACTITKNCPFTIDVGLGRHEDQKCMEPLSEKEKERLRRSDWQLHDKQIQKMWKKMCQAHMDDHWKKIGITIDHKNKRIYPAYKDEL